jgi:hypothetical protein
MSTVPVVQLPKSNGGLVQIDSNNVDDLIRQRVEEERQRLEQEAGIENKPVVRFLKPEERLFTADQRDHTTILLGASLGNTKS